MKDEIKTEVFIVILVCGLLVVDGKETDNKVEDVQIEINEDTATKESKIKDPPPQYTIENDYDPTIDDYPEHEPIMQPFDEEYEKEQEDEQKRKKEKIEKSSNDKAKEKPNEEKEPVMQSYGELFEDDFKTPEILLDGMADHEPIYQPEDPGDDNDINFPFHNEVLDKEKTKQSAKENIETNQIGGDEKPSKRLYDFDGDFDINDHEPIYQPEDPGEAHDEL